MHQPDKRAMAQQWQKTAEAMVQATYGRGPQAMTSAIASTMRTLTEDLIKAGTELSVQAVNAERKRCLAALDRYAAYEGEEDPFDLVAAAIRQPSPKSATGE